MADRGPATGVDRRAPRIVLALGIAAAAALAAHVGTAELLVVIALAVGVAAFELGTDFADVGLAASPLFYVVGTLFFPVAASLWQEPGLAGAGAALVLMAGARFVLDRPERGALVSIAAFVLSALYLGFGSAFLILLRLQLGWRSVAGFFLIALGFHAGRSIGDAFLGRRSLAPQLTGAPTLPGLILGLIGGFVGVVGFFEITKMKLRFLPFGQIGLAACAGLVVGTFAWGLMRPEGLPEERSVVPGEFLAVVAGGVLAAPALFYAIRLVLS